MNKPTAKTKGVVLYTRVSGEEQDKHGTSPETQRDACRAKAESLSLPIIAEYYDGGISGAFLLARPGMQSALSDIREGRADTLICPSMSRYSRDVEHQQAIKKAVKAAGGFLVFCDMNFEDTPEGDLNFVIQGGFAEYERKSIAARTEKGRRKRAAQGLQPARSRHPFGYHIVGKQDVLRGDYPADLLGKYLVIEEEAEMVRAIFQRYVDGLNSLSSLARWLNAQGIRTKHRNAPWAVTSLHSILSSPVYKGEASYGRHLHSRDEARIGQINPHTGRRLRTCHQQQKAEPGTYLTWTVPAIVSEEVWNAVQLRFKQNIAKCSGNPKRLRMLAGRITCPVCGGGMTVYQRGKRTKDQKPFPSNIVYQCSHFRWQQQNEGAGTCDRETYRIDLVEGSVLTCLDDAVTNRGAIHAARQALSRAAQPNKTQACGDAAKQKARIEAHLSALADRQAAAVKAQIAGIMAGAEPSAYAAVFAEIAEERKALEEQRKALEASAGTKAVRTATPPQPQQGLPKLLADARRVLASEAVPGDRKREIIAAIIERVYPAKDGARVVFLPGVFDGGEDAETLQPNT